MGAARITACLFLLTLTGSMPGRAETSAPSEPKSATAAGETPDVERFFQSIVKVHARAIPNARSSASLGQEREGSGVVIGEDGLVLTIGYLIIEADEVSLVDRKGRTLPARVVGYDHATGLGLVRAVVPLSAPPLPLGESAKLSDREPVMVADEPLLHLENAICTPHLGYVTTDEWELQFATVFDQINDFAAGSPTNVVNPAALRATER